MPDDSATRSALRHVLVLADFRRLLAGVTTSQLGDQFALIATPWLVLQLTGDPLTLGLVLALEGVPRAVFMLFGGAITDRFSPRIILLLADMARLVLAALMALAVLAGAVEIWMVYAFGLGFGLVAGFAVPAGNSIVPMIVDEQDLEAGNSLVMGGGQLVGFIGPTVAGAVIGYFSLSMVGVGLAFGIDAVTFAFSALMLWSMQAGGALDGPQTGTENEPLLSSITTAAKHVWHTETLRLMFVIIAAVNLLFIGPIMVGIPVLADHRLPEGAVAFGLLMSGFSGGNLAGYLLAGALPKPDRKVMRSVLIALLVGFAIVLGVMGTVASTWLDFVLLLGLGIGNGYVTIVLISAIQARVPKDMLGRIMGLLMFSSLGLVPVSQAISGAVSRWDVTLLFVSAAIGTLLVAAWAATQPALLALSQTLSGDTARQSQTLEMPLDM